MVEYGVNVNNKFLFSGDSDEELEDPSVLLQKAEVKKDDKTPAQKKAEKKAEKLKKEKAAAAAKEAEAKAAAAAAAKPAAGKENARPEGRGRGRGGPRGAGGERRPPRENTEGGEQRTFSGEGRGRGTGGPRGRGGRGAFRGGRGGNTSGGEETREVNLDETPKDGEVLQSGERPPFAGRGGRGRGGAFRDGERPARGGSFRDGERPAGRGGRGRFSDRQSGSDRTGVKSVDSKGGHGKSNWGSNKDEIEAVTENPEAEKSEEEAAVEQVPREKTAEEIAFEEEEAKIAAQKTLSEFRAAQKKEDKKFNLRQAGEGADEKNFGKLVPLQKERFEDEATEEEVVEIVKKEPRNKQIIVDFKFNEPNRGEFGGRGRGGDRGRRGGGGDRGARGARTGRGGAGAAGSGSARYNEPFRVAEDAFPALA